MKTLNEWKGSQLHLPSESLIGDSKHVKLTPSNSSALLPRQTPDTQFSEVVAVTKQSCWQCYKTAAAHKMAVFMNKRFCTADCAETFRAANLQLCQRNPRGICSRKFLKTDGLPKYGKWFCSPECEELD